MKLGFCLLAFVVGCIFAVLIRTNDSTAEQQKTESNTLAVDSPSLDPEKMEPPKLQIVKESFGELSADRPVAKFICTNANGLSFEVIEYGATIIAVRTPDREGEFANIALSCEGLEGYQACTSYFGAAVGRYCNRIADASFSLDGQDYQLTANDGENHLHGGKVGFDKRVWSTEEIVDADAVGVRMTLFSEDGDQGYPGKCIVAVTYLLNNDNQLTVEFTAESDAATPVNLTDHTYWNLNGAGNQKIYSHVLQIEADQVLEFNDRNLPTGKYVEVAGTRYDFTSARPIHPEVVVSGDAQGSSTGPAVFDGYDNNYCLRSQSGALVPAASVFSPQSGRRLDIMTTEPGVQFYTGNFLDGQPGSGGFEQHTGFCLETQHYPDSPNQPEFPSTVLRPGDQFKKTTIYSFSVVK